ncbi:MAG: type VI secretion system-associated FHA domain protein TagH [Acetobacteraceae bacterium]|nr:type VI secretion system-associated FHA domain protein TagH [Acetobacteraceae bacterium]
MRLTLSILRCPPSAVTETRSFDGGDISLGRGPDNDWVLADPERHLSKRHCTLAFRGGAWHVADQSSNGTFINGESDPLGASGQRRLSDGDRLQLGQYELEVRLSAARSTSAWSDPHVPQAYDDPFVNPFRSDPMGSPAADGLPPLEAGIRLPSDFDPMAPGPDSSWLRPAQPDASPATSDAFRPPTVAASLLPDDWADDLLPGPSTQPPPMQSPVGLPAQPAPAPMSRRPEPPPTPAPAPMPQPVMAPMPAAPMATAPAAPPVPPPAADHALLERFLRGAGMEGVSVADPGALMEQMGAAMRAMVSGLRQALIARSAVKNEFRIERTMISASGNNPLKFSADDNDALAALLGTRPASMPAPAAVADALRDMRLHELATMAALQSAVRELVARLDPAVLKQNAGGGAVPLGRKARAWDAFEALHATVTAGLADDFDSVFGKSFARSYERAQDDIARNEVRSP